MFSILGNPGNDDFDFGCGFLQGYWPCENHGSRLAETLNPPIENPLLFDLLEVMTDLLYYDYLLMSFYLV